MNDQVLITVSLLYLLKVKILFLKYMFSSWYSFNT